MDVSPGTRLGPYEIVAPLGAGGMGEVWKARDTRLDRSVAIKILPAELAANAMLRTRFEREAKTISQLSHPNICSLFDVGENYLVMELLEGESLADRLARGPLPINETLKVGAQIADALDRAHRAGIVHRDLKPGNIMLTKSGAKLLDFGLAKTETSVLGPRASVVETEHKPLTQEGTILGTFQYMAPEQLEGLDADARTDIFALGAVLYEMATGKPAFAGASKTSLIAAIVASEPQPIRTIQPLTSPAFEHVVKKCLAKDRDARWQSAFDIAEQLRWLAADQEISPREDRKHTRWWSIAPALAAVAVAGFLAARFLPSDRRPTIITAAAIAAPAGVTRMADVAVSPDGSRVVFSGRDQGSGALFLRNVNSFEATKLAGTEGATFPFWSPDGESIAFFTVGKLNRIAARGGAVQTICDAAAGRGGSWNRDGTIVYSPAAAESIWRAPAAGGTPLRVTTLAAGEFTHRYPAFLPDGKHFLFFARGGRTPQQPKPYGIWLGSIESTERKLVAVAASNPIFVPPSELLFFEDGNVVAQHLNLRTYALEGERSVVGEGVDYVKPFDLASFSASADVLIFRPATLAPRSLVLLDREGKVIQQISDPAFHRHISLAPDKRRSIEFRYDPRTQDGDLFIRDLEHGSDVRLTADSAMYSTAIWSADGRAVLYGSNISGVSDVFVQSLDSAQVKLVLHTPLYRIPCDWSADGEWILYEESNAATSWDLWLYHFGHADPPVPFLRTKFIEVDGAFSPDGRWIAYDSNEAGGMDVYIRPRDGGQETRISTHGGAGPQWRSDGRELFYVTPDSTLTAVDIQTTPSLRIGPPRALFSSTAEFSPIDFGSYSAARDGKSFLVSQRTSGMPPEVLNVVTNWRSRQQK